MVIFYIRHMKRFSIISIVALLAFPMLAMAQMTDNQVLDYIKSAAASGKSETAVAKELVLRGVTQDQLERVRTLIENSDATLEDAGIASGNPRQLELVETAVETPAEDILDADGSRIFGHDVFRNTALSFEPNENTATPEDYKLGPGDQLIIEIWGYNEASLTQTISPEGKINISQIGPIQLSGLTIKEASAKIRKALRSKYAGIGGDSPNSEVSITLGRIRSIQVNVMGEVRVPGTYRLSSFSTVFTALYRAGGVSTNGSLRAIKVVRGGEALDPVDVYGYLFDGKSDSDIRLQEGDIIIVPPYGKLVEIEGAVKRPMAYELADGETVADALEYAGGFMSGAHKDDVRIERKSGREREVITVSQARMATTTLEDGDVITAVSSYETYANRLEIRGHVYLPGLYQLGGDIKTVKGLVNAAGGLREDAFLARAIITREHKDLSLETITVPIGAIMKGTVADIALEKNDILTISGRYEINDRGTLTINGYITNPDTFPFAENTSVEDLIIRAGGLKEGASMARVDVSRRVSDPNGLMPSDTIGKTFTFSIKDGLAVDGADEFILKPYDVVSVRRSPSYQRQQYVTIAGEVAFPGQYVIQDRGETMSDIVRRAGGPTNKAYLNGGILVRKTNREEGMVQSATRRLMRTESETDSIDVDQVSFKENYTIGVHMAKAIQNPGSDYDITLREGDIIYVPEYVSTVSIQGDVMYPNVVHYISGKPLSYYINEAGGFGSRAKRSKVFIVYMNGNVSRASHGRVEPGCEIIVPTKGEKVNLSMREYLSLGTTSASLATMIVTMFNLMK